MLSREVAPTLKHILAWVETKFKLPDRRHRGALGEMVCGLMRASRVSFAEIGRRMEGRSKPASNITRVANWCHNPRIDPVVVQGNLTQVLLSGAGGRVGDERFVLLAMDWHGYDNGAIEGLRISLITGSRAIPLLWSEVPKQELSGRKSAIELDLVWRLIAAKPPGVKLVILLDAGFRNPSLLKVLDQFAYFVVRLNVAAKVHTSEQCWTHVRDLPVGLQQAVDFGWVNYTEESPFPTRVVGGRIREKRCPRRGRRRKRPRRDKKTIPGLCVLATNLPTELFDAIDLLRLYARRFEIEHSFRDIKNATLGMDMEHVHLHEGSTYARLMCVVALAELCLWLIGADAEARGRQFDLTPSRPKSGRRVLSMVRVGRELLDSVDTSIDTLIARRLWPATAAAMSVTGSTWKSPDQRLRTTGYIAKKEDLRPVPGVCSKKGKGGGQPCLEVTIWRLENADLERVA